MAIETGRKRAGIRVVTQQQHEAPSSLASPAQRELSIHLGTKIDFQRGEEQLKRTRAALFKRLLKEYGERWRYLRDQNSFRAAPLLTITRLVLWRIRCLLRWPATIKLRKWGVRMFLPAAWPGISKLVFAFREHYEPELGYLEQVLAPGKTFIDAGACYGIYTLAASKIVAPKGHVIAFEPAHRAFRVLRKNMALNHLTNVLAYPLALTEKKGRTSLYLHPNVGCDSLGRDHSFTDRAEETETDSLDNVLLNLSVDQVDMLKMDVQGAEELVLRGASRIIQSRRPLIIFEIFPEGAHTLGLSGFGAWELLENLGYEFFTIDQRGALRKANSPPAVGNVVAIYGQRAE